MSNSVNLALDVTKTGIQNPLIKVRQGDGGFETLRTTVTSNGEPMDLQGWTITFMGTTAGNHKIVDGNVTLVEAPNGIFDYTPSKAWGMDIGDFKIAYFKFVKGDGSASSANFRVSVIEAVDLTQEEAQNYISVVDTTIAEINQHLTDSLANVTQSIADANDNANTISSNVTALGNRVDDYNNKLAAIQVGGRNLLVGTKDYTGEGWQRIGILTKSDFQGMTSSYGSSAWSGPQYKNSFLASQGKITSTNDKYVLTALANNTGTEPIIIGFYGGEVNNQGYQVATLPANSGWVRIASRPFGFTKTTGLTSTIKFQNTTDVKGGVFKVVGLKLEIGNIPTDWTPAPEDAPSNDAQLVHKTGTETIAGDKTFTSPINGQLSGNAATATKWQTARTLALTGDVTGSVAIDGSGDVSIETTGANLVHKTGVEVIAGDKTFTGNVNFGSDTDWIVVSISTNGTGEIRYRRRFGFVELYAWYTPSTTGTATIKPLTLPTGFRPIGDIRELGMNGGSFNATSARMSIGTNGDIEIGAEPSFYAGTAVRLHTMFSVS